MHLRQPLTPGPSPARGEGSSSKPMDFFAPWRLCVGICVKCIIVLMYCKYNRVKHPHPSHFGREAGSGFQSSNRSLENVSCTSLDFFGDGLERLTLRMLVGAPGFEPGTSCAQGKRATRLRHAPILFRLKRIESERQILVFPRLPWPECATRW